MFKILSFVFFLALNLFSADLNEQQSNFETFLTTITGYSKLGLKVNLTDTSIILQGEKVLAKEFKKVLDKALSSRKELENKINYQICGDSTDDEINDEQGASFTLTSLEQGKTQLKGLLENALDEVCLDVEKFFDQNLGAKIENGALCSRIFNLCSGTQNTHQEMRKNLLSCFANKTCSDVRKAWNGEEKIDLPHEGLDEKKDSIFGLVNQLFTLTPLSAQKYCFRIDLEGIFNLCHPPISEINYYDQDQATITINKLHLLTYIKQLILGNVLLRVSKNSEGVSAIPMVISTKQALSRPTTHYLVIDISGSMIDVLSDLKIYLSEFLKHLGQENSASFVKLVFFNSETYQYPIYDIKEIALLEEIINEQKAQDVTRLYGTLKEVLTLIKNNENDHNISLTLFADGENNCFGSFHDIDLKELPSCNRPTSITFGLGDVDANLPNVALALGGKYFPISSIDELKKILADNALPMSSEHTFIKFITKLGEEAVRESSFNVSNQEIGIFIPDIVFEQTNSAQEDFYYGDKKISSFYEQIMRQSDLFDQMKLVSAKAIEIARNPIFSLEERHEKLKNIFAQIPQSNKYSTFSQQQHVEKTRHNVQRLIELVENAKIDSRLSGSLEASIATLTGIY